MRFACNGTFWFAFYVLMLLGNSLGAQVPFDFSDEFYVENGLDPENFDFRVSPEDVNATFTTSPDASHNNTRILETLGGYDSSGQLLYYSAPPAGFSGQAFLPNQAGLEARQIANQFRVFIFPKRDGDPTSMSVANRRQETLFDTTSGYFTIDPLGLWRLVFPRYADDALYPQWDPKLEELAARNGLDLDGTPVIKRLSEVLELESLGLLDLNQRPGSGAGGSPWVVCPLMHDPRAGSIAPDAFLSYCVDDLGNPVYPDMVANFTCLQLTGDFCIDPKMVLTPFVQPLYIPPAVTRVDPASLDPPPDPSFHQRYDEFPPVDFYDVSIRQGTWQFHPDLPPSTVWGFEGAPMGGTFYARYGQPYFVRYHNDLPVAGDGSGFGKPEVSIHLHNAHTASESDGNPVNFFPPGAFRDHHYAMYLAGNDDRETLNTLWYHDHRFEFTSQNTYKGLTGFTIFYDDRDSGNENDPNPAAFRYPSGQYDVVLQLADKKFDSSLADRPLTMDIFNTDGFLGDQQTVNMVVQPYMNVARRKYRFRILNAGPSRFYQVGLFYGPKQQRPVRGRRPPGITLIATDGNLLPHPVDMQSVKVGVAERIDIIVDFTNTKIGNRLYLVNQMDQINGQGPTGIILDPAKSPKMMEFRVTGDARDNSRVPSFTRDRNEIGEEEIVATREWVFDNQNGIWTINGLPFDPNRIDAVVTQGTAERWVFINAADDWEHPIHVHLEEHQVVARNGQPPPVTESGRKDVTVIGPSDVVEVLMRFRDFEGIYPIHCHNTVHEDHAMMLLWKVVAEGGRNADDGEVLKTQTGKPPG